MRRLKDKVKIAGVLFHRKFFRPNRRILKQVEFRGANFLVFSNEDVGWRLLYFKEYERDEIEVLEHLIREDDTCVDVGANIGIFSVFMARKAFRGKTLAFEPVPLNLSVLGVNLELNSTSNVSVHGLVVSDSTGLVRFSVSEDAAYSSMRSVQAKPETEVLKAQSDTLDNLFAEKGQRADVVKIDVEGAELLVLKGGERLLRTPGLRPRALLVELSAENQAIYGYSPGDVISYMETLDYDTYSITSKGLEKGWPSQGATNALFLCQGENR